MKKESKILLERVLTMMSYDSSKTSSENYVHIFEQPDEKMPGQIERFGFDRTKPETLKPALEKQQKYFDSFDVHDTETIFELSMFALAMVSGPAAPLFIGLGVAAGLTDAAVYWKEGNPYEAVMVAGLSLLGVEELAPIFKQSKVFQKYGPKKLIELIKKSKLGQLTEMEFKELKEFVNLWKTNAKYIESAVAKKLVTNFASTLEKKSVKYIINVVFLLKKLFPSRFIKMVFKIAGITYTLDQLYLFVFRDVILNQKNLDSQTKNEIRILVRTLTGHEKEVEKDLKEVAVRELESRLTEKVQKLKTTEFDPKVFGDVSDSIDFNTLNSAISSVKNQIKQKTNLEKNKSPSLDEVLYKNKMIKIGMFGDSVKEIKKYLYKLGFGNELSKDGINFTNYFGENTKKSVENYQDYKIYLKKDGIVGGNTLRNLINDYELKIDNSNLENKTGFLNPVPEK